MRPGKIPVFRTVGAGIAFLFVRFPGILRAAIIPGILAGASLFALHWYVLPSLTQVEWFGGDSLRNPYLSLPFVFIYLFATIMFLVGVIKVYFGEPIGPVYVGAGGSEWRLLGGTVTVVLVLFVLCGIPAIFLAWQIAWAIWDFANAVPPITRHVSQDVPPTLQQPSTQMYIWALGGFILLCFYTFLSLRFSLLVPASVQEGRFGVWRSWHLMRGNVWRMFWVLLFTTMFLSVLMVPILIGTVALLDALLDGEISNVNLDGSVNIDSFRTLQGLIELGANSLIYMVTMSLLLGTAGYAFQKLSDDQVAAATD